MGYQKLIQTIGFLIGYGSGNYMSKKIGEGDLDEAEETSTLAIALSFLIGVIILLFVFLFTEKLSVFLIGRSSSGILENNTTFLCASIEKNYYHQNKYQMI